MKSYLLVFFIFLTFTCPAKGKLAILHGPFLQHQGETGVTIIWTTNTNAVSWVEVTPTDINESLKYYSAAYERKEPTKVHSVRINNLNPGTTYSYTVYSQTIASRSDPNDKTETVAASSIGKNKPLKFRTNPLTENAVSFIAVNDIHGHHGQLKNLLKKADYPSADVIIFNGDMVHEMKNENHYFNGFMNTAIRMFAHEKPIVYARGNHETEGNHADAFPDYFKTPDGNLYYLVRRGPVCFVILDCGAYKDYSEKPNIVEKEFDQYRDRECQWLSEAIKTKDFTEASFRVAIIHVPPIGTWHGAVEIASKFVPVLNEANIDVMICGHLHRYYHRKPGDGINFPVVVNSNNTVVRAEADAGSLSLKIINKKGKQVDVIEVKK
ncbi:MAG TPA: FN3 domain-containing metallophosphoesterase family protein [Prolixibacteraceae bacterium]|nr:FN3 domain-containing metallophosphoesterase family protein [Prolixibacteraceae bacterium]